ncbi:MAG: prephenate dehydrogenase/arogenate dehydrogenase family protein [Candidatus Xiphinematobacter sp.]|nr:MAG: prephenate dehydrogenase/arogenate dehydrogenase family protein [Candidatus Xiphinematobacter sp.]
MKDFWWIMFIVTAALLSACERTSSRTNVTTGQNRYGGGAIGFSGAAKQDGRLIEGNRSSYITHGIEGSVESSPRISQPSETAAMGRLARKIRPFLDVDAVVTDVGSIKVFVTRELVPILGDCFLGGHPMAGSERSGLEAARWDLFLQAPCILTPLGPAHHPAVISRLEKVRDLWDSAGARIFEMTPEQHDTAVAFVSHLPHVTAAALVSTICSQPPSLQEIAGGGYRDATRIAQGAADLWLDVLLENREAILAALSHYDDQLRTLSHLLKMSDTEGLYNFLEKASVARSLLKN